MKLQVLDIDEIIGKAKMHAAEAYSHAKEAYSLRDEFFKLIEQHAYGDLDSRTKERLSLAAASLNAALGVADAAVATANMSADSAQGNPFLLDYNLLAAAKVSSRADDAVTAQREGLALGKKKILCEEEMTRQEEEMKANTNAALETVSVAAVTSPNIAAVTSPNIAAIARRKAVREGLARGKRDLLLEEERIRLEAQLKAEKESKKEKREEERKMRDEKRKQKMDKNTKKPKDKK